MKCIFARWKDHWRWVCHLATPWVTSHVHQSPMCCLWPSGSDFPLLPMMLSPIPSPPKLWLKRWLRFLHLAWSLRFRFLRYRFLHPPFLPCCNDFSRNLNGRWILVAGVAKPWAKLYSVTKCAVMLQFAEIWIKIQKLTKFSLFLDCAGTRLFSVGQRVIKCLKELVCSGDSGKDGNTVGHVWIFKNLFGSYVSTAFCSMFLQIKGSLVSISSLGFPPLDKACNCRFYSFY